MGRRKNDSPLDAILELATFLDWRIDLVVAIVAYLAFHHYATQPVPTMADPHAMGDFVTQTLFHTFSAYLQYLVPGLFLIGGAISFFNRKSRKKLLDSQTGIESLRSLSWREFEQLVGEAFRRRGYSVEEVGGGGADGGINLILRRDGQKTIVQCKRWKNTSVNVNLLRELYGVMTAEHADSGIFVSSGRYTQDAEDFAKGKPISLYDGQALVELIREVRTEASDQGQLNIKTGSVTPSCPLCGERMKRRLAKRGPNAGNEFWGCSRYPDCKGTI